MSDIEDQGSFRASRSIPTELVSRLAKSADVLRACAEGKAAAYSAYDSTSQTRDRQADALATLAEGVAELAHTLAGYEAEGRMNQDRSLT